MTGPYERPDFPYANQPAEEVRPPYVHCQPKPGAIRIGDRVRVIQGDHFVDAGAEGVVVNTATWTLPHRARVLLDNDTSSFIDFSDLEVTSPRNKAQQPTVMAPFPGSAA